ncbi:MAG: 2-amino-4-hydroxy-6-hydroxymethyldihydropteridine diphosphokinase [Mariprofundus sp.]
MADVLIGMGSNIEPEQNLVQAAMSLRDAFGAIRFSTVYRSPAIGMDGGDFLNACCLLQSSLASDQVRARLKALEDEQGRDRSKGSWKPRTLDLDLLMYDGHVLDDELYRYAHAFVPASELVEITDTMPVEGEVTPVVLRL